MNELPQAARLWRWLILLPIPYFVAVGVTWSAGRGGRTLSALAAGASLAFASLMWSRARGLRVAGYLGHALALTAAFGVGGALAVFNALGGVQGEPAGPLWLTLVLGVGAAASILSLVPLAAVVVADWSRPRQG